MAIIQSFNEIEDLSPSWYNGIRRTSIRLYDQINYDYATLYRVQPNVRVCVDFLARNIAQLGLHQFERKSETDRVRLRDFAMTRLIGRPLPPKYKFTYYRFIKSMVSDLGIYFNSYHLKLRDDNGIPIGLLRIPPQYMTPHGGLVIKYYRMRVGSYQNDFDPDDILHIYGYNPENTVFGLSPLETLRRVLAEEDSAGKYREELWRNSARMGGFIERPADASEWSDTARERFLREFTELYSGEGKGGKTAILEDGMTWNSATYSARESEYLGSRKLTREECARSYHIPLPMVGILDNATFSNISEQHKQLYQDSLGPWLVMIEQDLDLQLLPDFETAETPIDNIYSEFNILEKLRGDFEDTVKSLQSAIGRPWMTPNEGRAALNMPSLEGDADQLATPLNVLVGGVASPRDTGPKSDNRSRKYLHGPETQKADFLYHDPDLIARYRLKWASVLVDYFQRQERSIISRVNPVVQETESGKDDLGSGVWWDDDRWNSELKSDLLALNLATALEFAEIILAKTGVYDDNPSALIPFEERMIPYLEEHSRIQAENINQITKDQVSVGLADPDPLSAVKNVFKNAITVRALALAISSVTFGSSFGSSEAAQASNLRSKVWRVNSGNPRDSHAALDGHRVGIRETFPNGLRWPGDPRGPAEELAGCQCSVEFQS